MDDYMDSGIHDTGADGFASNDQNATAFAIPRWFLMAMTAITSCFSITFVPWSIWVTLAIVNMNNDIENRQNDALVNRNRIERLEEAKESHALQLQVISSTRFTAEQANALNAGTVSEIRALAAKVEALQRDFDRNFNKANKPILRPEEIETVGE